MTPEQAKEKRAVDPVEREASYFALCLLMPRDMFKAEVAKITWDLASDEPIKILAKKFDVLITAVAVRMAMLNYKL